MVAGNIKSGVKIFNVTGTFNSWVDSTLPLTNYIPHRAYVIYPSTTEVNKNREYKFIRPIDGTTWLGGFAYTQSYYNWAVKIQSKFSKIRCTATFWATPNDAEKVTITMAGYWCVVGSSRWWLSSGGGISSAKLTGTQSSVTLEISTSAYNDAPIGGITMTAKSSTSTNVDVGLVSWNILAVK